MNSRWMFHLEKDENGKLILVVVFGGLKLPPQLLGWSLFAVLLTLIAGHFSLS